MGNNATSVLSNVAVGLWATGRVKGFMRWKIVNCIILSFNSRVWKSPESLSVSASVVSVSLYGCSSCSLFIWFCVSYCVLFVSVCICFSVFMCVCLSLTVCVSASASVCLSQSVCFSAFISVCLSMPVCLSAFVSVCLCLSLFNCVSVCISMSLYVCLCL